MRMRGNWGFALALMSAAGVGLTGCGRPPQMPPQPPATVTVAPPMDRQVMEWDEFTGRLESAHPIEVRAQVSGYMKEVHFKEGTIVNKGDLLFTIDPRTFDAEVARTKGELERAKARLALAETEFKRTKSLVPSEAASELELEERKANLAEAHALVEVAGANLRMAEINQGYTKIRADITGRISAALVKPGNLVTGGGQGQATLLTTIMLLDPIYCYVDADERSVLKYQRLAREKRRPDVRKEDVRIPAKLALLNEDNFEHVGYIDFVDNRVDPTTGTLRARGIFPNPGGTMTPGLFGRMRVPGAEPYRTLLVAEAAIQSDQNTKYVLTVDARDTVTITPVVTGTLFGALRSIVSGLKGDERIVVNGLLRARPGATVNAVPGPMPGERDADALATTRVVEPPGGIPTTQPQTRPATAPTTTVPLGAQTSAEDRAAEAAPAGGTRERFVAPIIGVAQEVGR